MGFGDLRTGLAELPGNIGSDLCSYTVNQIMHRSPLQCSVQSVAVQCIGSIATALQSIAMQLNCAVLNTPFGAKCFGISVTQMEL